MTLNECLKRLRLDIVVKNLNAEQICDELAKLLYILEDAPSIYIPYCEHAMSYAHSWLHYCAHAGVDVTDYSDENMLNAFARCSLQPKQFMYNHIRLAVEEILCKKN